MAILTDDRPSHWAPPQYQAFTPAQCDAAYARRRDDIYLAVLACTIHFHPDWSRQQFADNFRDVITRLNRGGWGVTWQLTQAQWHALRDPNVDFERAWRAIDRNTVAAHGA